MPSHVARIEIEEEMAIVRSNHLEEGRQALALPVLISCSIDVLFALQQVPPLECNAKKTHPSHSILHCLQKVVHIIHPLSLSLTFIFRIHA